MSAVVTSYRNIHIRQKSCYIRKNDELYVQVEMPEVAYYDFFDLKVGMNITFKLGRSVRIYGQVSQISDSGFFVKNWSINNKGEKFAK